MHRWNTCPLTPSALRFTSEPCCDQAELLDERPVRDADPSEPALPPLTAGDQPPMLAGQSPNDGMVSAAAWSSGV